MLKIPANIKCDPNHNLYPQMSCDWRATWTWENFREYFAAHASPTSKNPQDLNPEVDKPGKRKKLDATARAGSEDKDAGKAFSLSKLSWQRCRNGRDRTLCWGVYKREQSKTNISKLWRKTRQIIWQILRFVIRSSHGLGDGEHPPQTHTRLILCP